PIVSSMRIRVRRNIVFLLGLALVASTATAQSSKQSSSKKSTPAKKTAAKSTVKKSSTAKKATSTAAASAALPKVEAPWRVAYRDANLLVTVDTSQTERLPDGTFRTRMRWKYAKDQKVESNKSYRTMIEYKLLECKKVRSKPIRATAYDADGNPV